MGVRTIKAWVYDTESEVQSVISAIDISKGYPDENTQTYCSYEENNGKWIIKRTPDMDVNFGSAAVDFNYSEPDT